MHRKLLSKERKKFLSNIEIWKRVEIWIFHLWQTQSKVCLQHRCFDINSFILWKNDIWMLFWFQKIHHLMTAKDLNYYSFKLYFLHPNRIVRVYYNRFVSLSYIYFKIWLLIFRTSNTSAIYENHLSIRWLFSYSAFECLRKNYWGTYLAFSAIIQQLSIQYSPINEILSCVSSNIIPIR